MLGFAWSVCVDFVSVVFPQLLFQEVGVAALVHEAEDVERVAFDFIVEQVREGAAAATGKTMRADVIATVLAQDRSHRRFYPGLKIFA